MQETGAREKPYSASARLREQAVEQGRICLFGGAPITAGFLGQDPSELGTDLQEGDEGWDEVVYLNSLV